MDRGCMIDVLYIKGCYSPNNDEELRYSLRSLSKMVDLGRVFITGNCPKFVENVIHTPAKDIGCRMINHWWKVHQTILQTDISDNFVLMYDDIFFTKNVSMGDYPAFNRGILGTHINGTPLYRKNLQEAWQWLYDRGLPRKDFELHIPIIYNRENFLKLEDIYKGYIKKEVAPAVRSVYGNLFVKDSPFREDLKLYQKGDIIDSECISTTDGTFKYALEYLKQEFPNRGKYENSLLHR